MPTYELRYAEQHLPELFEEARDGEDVIIVRADGLSCQLIPIANVKERKPLDLTSAMEMPELGALAPA